MSFDDDKYNGEDIFESRKKPEDGNPDYGEFGRKKSSEGRQGSEDDFFRDDDFEFEEYGRRPEPEDAGYRSKKTREKRKRRKLIVSSIAIMLVLALVAAGIVFGYRWIRNRFFDKAEATEEERISVPGSLELGQDMNIVFALSDDNLMEPDVDAIIFSSYYSINNELRSLCIPVKTLMDVPGIGAELVGKSVGVGGMDLLSLTLEKGLGMNLKIDYYILIDALNTVNSLGGLELNLDKEVTVKNYEDSSTFKMDQGKNIIDGSEAINFLKYFSGIERDVPIDNIKMQKVFLDALIDRIVGADDEEFAANLNSVKDFIDTDLSLEELMKLFSTLSGLGSDSNKTYVLDVSSTELEGEGIVYLPDVAGLAGIFSLESSSSEQEEASGEESVNITILNGVGTPGIAGQVKELLESRLFESGKKKFNILEVGNADNFNYSQTEIRTYTQDKAYVVNSAEEIRQILGVGNVSNIEEDMGMTDIVLVLGADIDMDSLETGADTGTATGTGIEGVAKIIILNGEGTAGLASTVKDILENHFNAEENTIEVTETKDADNWNYTQTEITVYTSGEAIEDLAGLIQERLGVGVIKKSDTNPDNIDISILLASDYTNQ